MRIRTSAIVALTAIVAMGAVAQAPLKISGSEGVGLQEDENVLYGENYLFSLKTPIGWVVDSEVAKELGIDAVFYPKSSSWKGPVSMYPRVWQKGGNLSLDDVISQDLEQYRANAADVVVAEAPAITISKGVICSVRQFASESQSLHEAVAYIDQPTVVIVVVLRARNDSEFQMNLSLFGSLVRSFRDLSPQFHKRAG